ncbi:MAG: hypothetical protein IT184_00120 [Acidobacteria bacterium]|nr:hypothetical protein [Acidobacteriota bacterium]
MKKPFPRVRHNRDAAVERRGELVRYLWIVALLVGVTFCVLDSTARLRAVWEATDVRIFGSPRLQEDRSSLSGYVANQHRLVVPSVGVDGYHWIMQTERMVAGTEDWRVRHVDYDHPPDGRGVEWGGFLHWEVAAMAWLATHLTTIELPAQSRVGRARDFMFGPYRPTGLPINLAIERVAPWTNTVTLVLVIAASVPLIAWRFGSMPASLMALGFVAVHPLYESFSVGYLDHHGLAATWVLFTILFLIAGGGGWLRSNHADLSRLTPAEGRLWHWLPPRRQAQRWFVASAMAGGTGLWESASSQAPVLVALGLGITIGTVALAPRPTVDSPWRFDPTLWRTWGLVGAATSLAFYLLEYFPSHFGWNLQVNHPLYALAWLGGGDLMCRICEWRLRGGVAPHEVSRQRTALLMVADLLMLAALPVTVAFTARTTFVTVDPFLWQLCRDYIVENQPLLARLAGMDPARLLGQMSAVLLLPVLLLFAVVLLFRRSSAGGVPQLPTPWKGLLGVVLSPSLVLLALAIHQSRWLATSCAVWLALLVVMALLYSSVGVHGRGVRMASAAFVGLLLVPFPASAIAQWRQTGLKAPLTQADLTQIITRDASYRLRQRLGSEPGVILSGPSTTTWMTYFGGFKGLGTLYSDNLDGLKAVAEIYSAPSPETALELCKRHGVTHIAIFSWDAFAQEYPKLWHGLSRSEDAPPDAFIARLLQTGSLPNWLRPIPYAIPSDMELATQYVRLFEVVPDQSQEEAIVRLAEYFLATDKPEAASRQLQPLLTRTPSYLPALVSQARAQYARGEIEEFAQTVAHIRANPASAGRMHLDDAVALAMVMALANDPAYAREQLRAALRHADEQSIRRLLPGSIINLLGLMRRLDLATEYALVHRWAFSLLPPEAEVLVDHG